MVQEHVSVEAKETGVSGKKMILRQKKMDW